MLIDLKRKYEVELDLALWHEAQNVARDFHFSSFNGSNEI